MSWWLLLGAALALGTDPCQPHGETNVIANGTCWGAGADAPCFSCWYGPKCSLFNSSSACLVDAERNYFLMWQDELESFPATTLPASWAMPYQSQGIVPPLEAAIRAMHKMVGNANPDGSQVLLCPGARSCAAAVIFAMNAVYGASLQVFARTPYFTLDPAWVAAATTGAPTDAIWNASADATLPTSVEILTSPNNPDGAPHQPSVREQRRLVCDSVYNWPWNHYPVSDLGCDTTLFSMSKCTGHCGSRLGWALMRDPALFDKAYEYVVVTAGGVSVEAQARSHSVLTHLLATNGSLFGTACAALESRWDSLDEILPSCLENQVLLDYNKEHRGPLLWITAPAAVDGLKLLAAAGILGEPGTNFGAGANSARVNLVGSASSWALLLPRLRQLCAAPARQVWARVEAARAAAPARRHPFVA